MELETKISLWMDVEDLKAINDWDNMKFVSSGKYMDARDALVKKVMEVVNRQWDVDYAHKEANK